MGWPVRPDSRGRLIGRAVIGVFYLAAGIIHLARPAPFLAITPDWVPWPEAVVALTGAAEIAGALGMWLRPTQRAAAIALALYAICVWPANFNHMLLDDGANMAYHAIRLPLQIPLIWLTLWAGEVLDWPMRLRH
jgi:uncharacterized membrane protein